MAIDFESKYPGQTLEELLTAYAEGKLSAQPDWDEESEEALSYIKNKPFGIIGRQNSAKPLSISGSTIGTNLFEVYTDVCFQIGSTVYNTLHNLGKEIPLSVYGGPTVVVTVVKEGEKYFVKHISGGSLIGDVTYCNRVTIKTIPEAYIPDFAAIRDGAAKGATALQGSDTSEELDDVETNTYVKYTTQSLTEEQREQARKNIGAASTSYIISVFEEIKALIKNGDYDEVVAVLDKAILDFATLG